MNSSHPVEPADQQMSRIIEELLSGQQTVLCGEIHRGTRSLLVSLQTLPDQIFDVGFFGGTAYTKDAGLMERESGVPYGKQILAGRCRHRYALVPKSKIDRFGPCPFLTPKTMTRLFIIEDTGETAHRPRPA